MNTRAPAGKIYQCRACGKLSRWLYGFDDANRDHGPNGKPYHSYAWDESCVLNAELVDLATVDKRRLERLAP